MKSVRQDEPFEIQPRANGAMARALQVATVSALISGLLGTLVPGPVGVISSRTALGLVIAAPLVRVLWLALRWRQRRDYRYALTAVALLGLVLGGAILATLQG